MTAAEKRRERRRLRALRTRLERVYMNETGNESSWGAQAWFRRVSGLWPSTITRMLAGEIASDRMEAILDLEEGRDAMAVEVRRLPKDGGRWVARWIWPPEAGNFTGAGETPEAALIELAKAEET